MLQAVCPIPRTIPAYGEAKSRGLTNITPRVAPSMIIVAYKQFIAEFTSSRKPTAIKQPAEITFPINDPCKMY